MLLVWKKIWPLLVLLALAAFLFLPQLLTGTIPYAGDYSGSDLTELNIPFRDAVADSFRRGEFPLWTNLLGNGWPILAEGQSGVFYPVNILFFIFLPLGLAVLCSFVANFFLGSVFTYLYARVIRLSSSAALLAAIAFSYSGFFVFRIKHLNLINAAIWLPLAWYVIEKILQQYNKKYLVLLSLVFAIQFFAGHPQISYITIVASFVYFVLRYISIPGRKGIVGSIKMIFGSWLLVGILTFGLCAIQFLPTYELSRISTRNEWINYDTAVALNFRPSQLLTIFSPYLFGNPATGNFDSRSGISFWESSLYFGIISLLLAVYYLYQGFRKRTLDYVLVLLAIASFLLILGKFSPVHFWTWQIVPGMKMFRFSQRFLLVLTFCLSIFAAIGFDVIYDKFKRFLTATKKYSKSKFLRIGLPMIVILILVTDLFFMASKYVGFLPSEYFTMPKSAEFLHQKNELARTASFFYQLSWMKSYEFSEGWQNNMALFLEERELLQPNLSMLFNVELYNDRGWNEGGQLDARLAHIFSGIDQSFFVHRDGWISLPDQTLKVLGMQNVKYILSFYEIKSDNLVLAEEIRQHFLPPLKIYENKFFLPRAFLIGTVQTVADEESALSMMFGTDFSFQDRALVETEIAVDSGFSESDHATVIDYQNQEMIFDVVVNSPKLLVVSKTFYPGWQATIDGRPQEIIRTNNAFSGVVIPSGQHQVKFQYQPKSFIMGRNITALTLLLLVVFFVFDYSKVNKARYKLWSLKKT
ncbi:MAG: YfhO family protein [Candidatus Buchananbacteria bacterium]|nr:YfhO family protein [Candidatus Buchananbacteria bacterium]